MAFALKGEILNFKAMVSIFYLFYMFLLPFSGHGVSHAQLFFQVLSPGSSYFLRSCVHIGRDVHTLTFA